MGIQEEICYAEDGTPSLFLKKIYVIREIKGKEIGNNFSGCKVGLYAIYKATDSEHMKMLKSEVLFFLRVVECWNVKSIVVGEQQTKQSSLVVFLVMSKEA